MHEIKCALVELAKEMEYYAENADQYSGGDQAGEWAERLRDILQAMCAEPGGERHNVNVVHKGRHRI